MKKIALLLLFPAAFSIYAAAQKTPKADIRKTIDKATPKALPQTPVAKKLKSDAEDENLKGKVKSLIEEREGLTGIEKPVGRRLALIADFNQKGDYLRQVYFDYKGTPFQVTVYGYIDGARVSTSKLIGELKLGSVVREEIPQKEEPPQKPDPRYEHKYEYKYVDGKLAEMQMFYNNGTKGMRYVYNHKGNQMEKLVYIDTGKLNQKYLITFDEKSNEIQWVDFNIRQREPREEEKFSFKYESFDEKGNWTKRTFSKIEIDNGKEAYKPIAIEYRTITYYP